MGRFILYELLSSVMIFSAIFVLLLKDIWWYVQGVQTLTFLTEFIQERFWAMQKWKLALP